MMTITIIIGIFWVINHKLPGFGINPEIITVADGKTIQYNLIQQGACGAAPWIDMGWDMGWAIA